MSLKEKIEVRDLVQSDIKFITNYWLNSDEEHLQGMGVDLNKIPSKEVLMEMLLNQINSPDSKKDSLALIIEKNGRPIGHCNVNEILFGKEAKMHLHIWKSENRKKGLGTKMVMRSLPIFFKRLNIEVLWCEPYAFNDAPNRTLKNIGFEFEKKYLTIPGSLNFKQQVNRYKLTKKRFEEMVVDNIP